MEIYLDSANIEEIKIAKNEWGIIDGVTTNPTLIVKESKNFGKNYEDVIREILSIIGQNVSVETVNTNTNQIIDDAKRFALISDELIIKIPVTNEGLMAINKLRYYNLKINATLIFSANQALLASLAGADYVSIFVGRLDDIGHSGINVVKETVDTIKPLKNKTKIISASIRHPLHIIESIKAGADIVTVPFNILEKMINHPLTNIGLEKFMKDVELAKMKI